MKVRRRRLRDISDQEARESLTQRPQRRGTPKNTDRSVCATWEYPRGTGLHVGEMGSSVLDPYERKGIPKTQVKNRT